MKEFLIVGIDPGTTTGIAVLNLDGNVKRIRSYRNIGIERLTKEIFSEGKPIIIGTDVNKVPKSVENFSKITGAKIVGPEKDIKVEEKNSLTKNYELENYHERDALVAAMVAYKKVKGQIKKVESALRKEGKEDLMNKVKELILKGKAPSIFDAVKMLERKEERKTGKRKVRTESIKVKKDPDKELYKKMKSLEFLVKKLKKNETKLKKDLNERVDEKVKRIVEHKNKKIHFLNKKLKEYEDAIMELKNEINELKKIVENKPKDNVLKRIIEEYKKERSGS